MGKFTKLTANTFVTGLTVKDFETIHTVKTALVSFSVHAFLRASGVKNHIAIFYKAHLIAVIRVFHRRPHLISSYVRDFALKLIELLEERSREVEVAAKLFAIPVITPPILHVVYWEGLIR